MWYFHSLHGHVRREVEKADVGPAPTWLDAGCGTGGLILRMREAWPRARFSGIDFMPLAVELAHKRCGPAVKLKQASITDLPFGDASFDVVTSVDVISQVDEDAKGIAECFRVLRPGGIFITNVPAYMWMWSYHDDSCQTKRRYTRTHLSNMLRSAGFQVRTLTHWNAIPFPLIWARRKLMRQADDTSDVKAYPPVVQGAFNAMMAVEHSWLETGRTWSWGSSVFCAARKP